MTAMSVLTRDLMPASAGLVGMVAAAVAADVWAVRTDRPTISRAVATALAHPVLAPLAVGVLSGIGWHLLCDPIIRRLEVS